MEHISIFLRFDFAGRLAGCCLHSYIAFFLAKSELFIRVFFFAFQLSVQQLNIKWVILLFSYRAMYWTRYLIGLPTGWYTWEGHFQRAKVTCTARFAGTWHDRIPKMWTLMAPYRIDTQTLDRSPCLDQHLNEKFQTWASSASTN
jgi:hypothetical protein